AKPPPLEGLAPSPRAFQEHAAHPIEGLGCLTPTAQWEPVYPKGFPHSSMPLSRRTATQERSNCLGCQGSLVYFLVLDFLGWPGCPMLQHGIENRQHLMHARRQSDFFEFPCSEQPLIKDFDLWIKPGRHERAHVQHGAHMRATAPDGAPASQGPTVAI